MAPSEECLSQALHYISENPEAKIATVAREFGVNRMTLKRRTQGTGARVGIAAHNTKLSRPEEAAVQRYIDRLDAANFTVRPEFITDAANYILQARTSSSDRPEDRRVGKRWTTRFIQRHGYNKQHQKNLDSNREASEDITRVRVYFEQLEEVITVNGIVPEDIWNMDETGFRIGISKDQLVVTKRKTATLFAMPENRESATAIEAIAADGRHLPAFLILTGQQHMANWYRQPELHNATIIGLSPTRYSNDTMSLQ